MDVITYPCMDLSYYMLVKGARCSTKRYLPLVSPSTCWIYLRKHKHIFSFDIISGYWNIISSCSSCYYVTKRALVVLLSIPSSHGALVVFHNVPNVLLSNGAPMIFHNVPLSNGAPMIFHNVPLSNGAPMIFHNVPLSNGAIMVFHIVPSLHGALMIYHSVPLSSGAPMVFHHVPSPHKNF